MKQRFRIAQVKNAFPRASHAHVPQLQRLRHLRLRAYSQPASTLAALLPADAEYCRLADFPDIPDWALQEFQGIGMIMGPATSLLTYRKRNGRKTFLLAYEELAHGFPIAWLHGRCTHNPADRHTAIQTYARRLALYEAGIVAEVVPRAG